MLQIAADGRLRLPCDLLGSSKGSQEDPVLRFGHSTSSGEKFFKF